jgi:hypothetical protein
MVSQHKIWPPYLASYNAGNSQKWISSYMLKTSQVDHLPNFNPGQAANTQSMTLHMAVRYIILLPGELNASLHMMWLWRMILLRDLQ